MARGLKERSRRKGIIIRQRFSHRLPSDPSLTRQVTEPPMLWLGGTDPVLHQNGTVASEHPSLKYLGSSTIDHKLPVP